MLSSFQRGTLRYGTGGQLSAFGGLLLTDRLSAELVVRSWWFPSSLGYGRSTLFGAGLRFAFLDTALGAALINGNLGAGWNGNNGRFMFDAGLGYGFHVDRFDIGPILRYGQVVAAGSDDPFSAMFWSLGGMVIYRFGAASSPATPATVTEAPAPQPGGAPAAPKPAALPPDRDKDGVDDLHDACPDLAQGVSPNPEQPGCPDGDEDKDGIADHRDQCPKEAKGLRPDPARPGCPLPDRDHDSVPDADDHCPDKPGAPSPDPKLNGCPGLVKVEAGKIQINRPIFFATNSDKILSKSFPVLTAVADALRATEEIKRVAVEGHTDGQGKADHNLELSQRRADSVRAWLMTKGIDGSRLESHGYGDTRPVATNKTSKGRAANRRVEFLIVEPSPIGAEGSPR